MIVDALILAGGRSSRLGGSAKRDLEVDGVSLLAHTVAAVRAVGAAHVVVVGDEGMDGVVTTREDPPFTGPVAAIARGLRALPSTSSAVFVLACDMPGISAALPILLSSHSGDGVIAVDRGRRQQLAFLADAAALRRSVEGLSAMADAPVRALLEGLTLGEVVVPDGATDDIDTWEDAARFGILRSETLGSPA